jgi:cytochrome c biogenesis protein ResB
MKKLRTILLKRQAALLLMGCLGCLSLISLFVPQVRDTTWAENEFWYLAHPVIATIARTLELDHVFTSLAYLGLAGTMLVSLSFASVQLYRRRRVDQVSTRPDVNETNYSQFSSVRIAAGESIEPAIDKLVAHGYRVDRISADRMIATKHFWASWGTLLLHLGMIAVISVSVVYVLTERRGFVQLIEGDTFFGQHGEFLAQEQGPWISPFKPELDISLVNLAPTYYASGELMSLVSTVRIGNSSSMALALIGINAPHELNGLKVYQSTSFGKTVCLLSSGNGRTEPIYYSLDRPTKPGGAYVGQSDLPTTAYLIDLSLVDDASVPTLHLKIEEGIHIAFDGTLKKGESATFEGRTLTFKGIRMWSGLIVTETYGVTFVFVGFVLILIGLAMTYIFPVREFVIDICRDQEAVTLLVGGVARREKALFAEEYREVVDLFTANEVKAYVRTELAEV